MASQGHGSRETQACSCQPRVMRREGHHAAVAGRAANANVIEDDAAVRRGKLGSTTRKST